MTARRQSSYQDRLVTRVCFVSLQVLELDLRRNTVRVQAGITLRALLSALDDHKFSIPVSALRVHGASSSSWMFVLWLPSSKQTAHMLIIIVIVYPLANCP